MVIALALALGAAAGLPARDGDLAVYFGTFDPPHLGHLSTARTAAAELGVAKVWLVPNRVPRGKPGASPYETRLGLCRALAARYPELGVLDPARSAAAYAAGGEDRWVELLLEELYRGLAPGNAVLHVMGLDSFNKLLELDALPRAGEPRIVAVVERAGYSLDTALLATRKTGPDRIRFVDATPFSASSTEVRRRVRAGQPIDDLVPRVIRVMIEREGLYRGPSPVGPADP